MIWNTVLPTDSSQQVVGLGSLLYTVSGVLADISCLNQAHRCIA